MANRFNMIMQKISAGNQFNGAEPTTDPAISEGIKKYPVDSAGGKIDFGMPRHVLIRYIYGTGGGAATDWSLVMTDGSDSVTVHVTDASTERLVLKDPCVVPEGWWLELTTTGATSAMTMLVMAEPSHIEDIDD